jgi:hypothetical protein
MLANDWYRTFRSAVPEGKSGAWGVERLEISEAEATVARLRSVFSFSERRLAPPAGTYTRLVQRCHEGVCGTRLVMSDTPAELHDLIPFVERATGHVLIAGLGLGIATELVLGKPGVTSVTVLEVEKDVIALVHPHLARWANLTVIHADARTWKWPRGQRWDAVWLDIWNDLGQANEEDARLHRRYARVANWWGSWLKSSK